MYCEKCGAKIEKDANYCDVCGTVLKENSSGKIDKFLFIEDQPEKVETLEIEPDRKTNKKNHIIAIVSVVVITLAMISLAILGLYVKKEDSILKGQKISGTLESSNNKISDDWTETEFTLAKVNYKLDTSYKTFEKNNWKMDENLFSYKDMTLIKNDKTSVSIIVSNNEYDVGVKIGLINLEDKRKNITECEVWGISVDNGNRAKPVEFKLSKGITNGSTKEDIIKAYGELPEDKIKVLDDGIVLQYQKDYSVYLDLTIKNDKGLESFSYKKY